MSSKKRKVFDPAESDDDDRKPPAKVPARGDSRAVAKVRIHEEEENNGGGIDVFSIDLVSTNIFSYLDTKELYAMSKTSKFLRGLIQHKHIVRSALINGGHTKKSMERIFELVKSRKIWIPSALRLLRICNGKRCERCNKGKVNFVSGDYGVFFCWDRCIVDTCSRRVGWNKKWAPFLNHPRVAAASYSSNAYVFAESYTEKYSDIPSGPLITKEDMDKILAEKQKGKEQSLIGQILEEHDENDGNAKYAQEIVETFEESKQDAIQRSDEKAAKEKQATENAVARKKQKVLQIVERLSNEISDTPWKRFALEYETLVVTTSTHPPIKFKSALTGNLLEELIRAPSKANKGKIAEVKATMEEAFTYLWEHRLHDLASLPETDDYDRALKLYAQKEYVGNYLHLRGITLGDIEKLRNEGSNPLDVPFWPGLYGITRPFPVEDALKATLVSALPVQADTDNFPRIFVLQLWKRIQKEEPDDERAAFSACLEFIRQTVNNFLNSPEATAWADKKNCEKDDVKSQVTVCRMLVKMCSLHSYVFGLLETGDHKGVLKWFDDWDL